jgi:2-haloacid dehalogenase
MNAFPLIVFDVNETLLDLTTLEPTFERIFGDQGAMRLWFANFILYSSALTVAGCLCAFHGYWFGCDEDAGRHARNKDR